MGKRKKKFKGFEGYDYIELANKWGVKLSDYSKDEGDVILKDYIVKKLWKTDDNGEPTQKMRNAADDIRIFCEALSKYEGYLSGLWKAVAEIEDDFSLFQVFVKLLPMAWN